MADADASLIEAARALCLEVHPYTVNDPAGWAAAELGVTACSRMCRTSCSRCGPHAEPRGLDAVRAAAARYRACREAQDRQDLLNSSTPPM
jgi:hypothetical protein